MTINHTARTISCRPIGTLSTVVTVVNPKSWLNPELTVATTTNAAPMSPQPDSHRGTTRDPYITR